MILCAARKPLSGALFTQLLIIPDAIQKHIRGKMDYRLETSSETMIVSWNDNSLVTVASTASGLSPTKEAR